MTPSRVPPLLAAAASVCATAFAPPPAAAQPRMTCDAASFAQLGLAATRIVSAAPVQDDTRAGPHCVVRGAVNERTGSDGKPNAIGFEMRLPNDSRFRTNNFSYLDDFYSFYPVSGMAHCGDGPATNRFDAFAALVGWVEHGRAPGSLTATVRADNPELPADWSRTRSRPLCPWPQVARYRGTGDLESAASFVCE